MKACTTASLPAAAAIVQPNSIPSAEEPFSTGEPLVNSQTSVADQPIERTDELKAPNGEVDTGGESKPMPTDSKAPSPVPAPEPIELSDEEIFDESSRVPLDAAIAASIAACKLEPKVRSVSSTILLIGGSSALKGIGGFIAER